MCGIAGFFAPEISSPEAQCFLRRMLRAIEHRGPDGEGRWSDSAAGLHLGMRRLSIIDLEGGRQPVWNEDRTVAVFFNGEIYNYLELRRELEAAGHVFRTRSDTEVLVHLYERDGEAMFGVLRGMFGLAIYDLPRRRLLVARDAAGQKPFFYFRDARRFAFASEIKSLLTLPFVPDDLNPEALLDYLSWFSLPAPLTHYQGIHKLPPGSFLALNLDDLLAGEARSFVAPFGEMPPLSDPEEAVLRLDEALKESAELHLRSDVPVGILLSSGLDSRVVATYAREASRYPISSFTAVFAEGDSEQAGAEESARRLGARHYNVLLTAKDLAETLPQIAWYLDEPVADPAAFALYKVCGVAREHVKVLLGGEGSDELFAGYAGRYRGILATLRRSNEIRRWAGWLAPALPRGELDSAFGRFSRRARLSEAEETLLLRTEGFPGDVREPLELAPGQMDRWERRARYYCSIAYKPAGTPLETLLRLDRLWQLAESLLVKADRMSMGASVELRSPFLDSKIGELADRMDMTLKLPPHGAGKWIVQKCLERHCPGVLPREKKGFPIPLDSWLRGPLRPQVEAALFDSGSTLGRFLDPKRLRAAWNSFLQQRCPAPFFYALWLYETWRQETPRRVNLLRTDV